MRLICGLRGKRERTHGQVQIWEAGEILMEIYGSDVDISLENTINETCRD